VTFYDPTKAQAPWAPQRGWNGKLLWRMGASASVSRFQTAPGTSVFNDNALRRGFMVASSSFTDHGTNSNDTFGAEMMVMVKEHIAENYGSIRYNHRRRLLGRLDHAAEHLGSVSGTAERHPAHLQLSRHDDDVHRDRDCGVLQNRYYATADGSMLKSEQRAAINGHKTTRLLPGVDQLVSPRRQSSVQGNCGSGWPATLTYSTTSSPARPTASAVPAPITTRRWSAHFVDTDGNTKANQAGDNEGVQYGLKALQMAPPKGITPEEFVRLNEGVGSYTADLT